MRLREGAHSRKRGFQPLLHRVVVAAITYFLAGEGGVGHDILVDGEGTHGEDDDRCGGDGQDDVEDNGGAGQVDSVGGERKRRSGNGRVAIADAGDSDISSLRLA